MNVTDSQFDMLSRLLNVASLRHQVIAQNVANVNTPGYRQRDVSFEDTFLRQLDTNDPRGTAAAPRVIEGSGGAERIDGNNVDIDMEIGRLQKNTLLHNAFVQILAGNIATMRSAITGH